MAAGKTTSTAVSNITVTGNLTMNEGSYLRVRTRSTVSKTNSDVFKVTGNVTLTSPIILMSQLNDNYNYLPDTDIKFIDCSGNITINGDVTIQPAIPMAGYKWDTTDISSGIIRVVTDPTAINQINADELTTDDVLFDISGHRLSSITKSGIYIVNGTKTFVNK
jgi:hypothetical protein